MPATIEELGIDQWTSEDRLKLIADIWDSIDLNERLELSDADREELDRRIAAADADPSASRPWQEVISRLQAES
jgi:putative addiction module component (TIGR02574 family)